MRFEDLPESLQRQVRAKAGIREPRKKDRTGDGRTGTDGVCWGCGERFTSTTAWEKHSDTTGHRRFELVADLPIIPFGEVS